LEPAAACIFQSSWILRTRCAQTLKILRPQHRILPGNLQKQTPIRPFLFFLYSHAKWLQMHTEQDSQASLYSLAFFIWMQLPLCTDRALFICIHLHVAYAARKWVGLTWVKRQESTAVWRLTLQLINLGAHLSCRVSVFI